MILRVNPFQVPTPVVPRRRKIKEGGPDWTQLTPKTKTVDLAKINTISTVKPAEEDSASRAGVTKADLERPNIRQPDATRFTRSRLYQFPLSDEKGASGVECWLLRRAEFSLQNQILANGLVKLSLIQNHLRHRWRSRWSDASECRQQYFSWTDLAADLSFILTLTA